MRMSGQARKILLVLRGNIDPTDPGKGNSMTLKAIAGRLEGDSVFFADGRLLDSVRSASIRRTLKALISARAGEALRGGLGVRLS